MHLDFRPAPSELPEIDNIRFPRWLQILAGAAVALFALFCEAAVGIILVALFWHRRTGSARVLTLTIICAPLLGAGIFLFRVSYLLLAGRDRQDGYSSPRGLQMTSCAFIVLALLVADISLQSPHKPIEFAAALGYLWIAWRLWTWALKRKSLVQDRAPKPLP